MSGPDRHHKLAKPYGHPRMPKRETTTQVARLKGRYTGVRLRSTGLCQSGSHPTLTGGVQGDT